MVWMDYQRLQAEYERTQGRLSFLLNKREELETALEPSAIRYDKDIVQTSREDHTTAVLAKIADLDILIAQADKTVQLRREILSRQREILEASADIHDRIYVLYFIRHHGVRRISREISYSRRQVYRILAVQKSFAQNQKLVN